MSSLHQISATGDVAIGGTTLTGRQLHAVTLTPGSTASTVVLRDGGSGGTVVLTLAGVANGSSVTWRSGDKNGVRISGAMHATFTGTGTLATIEHG